MDMSIQRGDWKGRIGVLAQRELECLLGVACGFSSKEIAKQDGCSPATVDKRLLSASCKLQVFKRAQLVAEAMKRGLIAPMMIMLAVFSGYQAASSLDSDHQRRGPSRRVVEMRVLKAREDAAQAA